MLKIKILSSASVGVDDPPFPDRGYFMEITQVFISKKKLEITERLDVIAKEIRNLEYEKDSLDAELLIYCSESIYHIEMYHHYINWLLNK